MDVIEALHPDGWRQQSRARFEYWACQEAQPRHRQRVSEGPVSGAKDACVQLMRASG